MAKIQELYDRASGETMYPVSTTRAVICPNGSDLETRLTSERKDIESRLGNVRAKEVVTPDNFPDIKTLTREELKMDLFIDMFNAKAGNDGYARITSGVFDCQLNGVSLTYADAINIMLSASVEHNYPTNVAPSMAVIGIRTHFPLKGIGNGLGAVSLLKTFKYCRLLEVSIINGGNFSSLAETYYGCTALKKVIIGNEYGANYDGSTFGKCTSLEDFLTSSAINSNINFVYSPKLSLASMQNIVLRGKDGITITVHPDVYAKLTDETNTEWHKVLIDAAAKNITFATA